MIFKKRKKIRLLIETDLLNVKGGHTLPLQIPPCWSKLCRMGEGLAAI